MIVDNYKEQSLGEFRRKCCEADCHLINSEPYLPWQIFSEGCIKELKKASSRKLISTGSPKVLWDHCIKLMTLTRLHTAHTAYELQGEVPETIMTGQTADISNICDYDWYEWVMFRDNTTSDPYDKQTLDRYIGPATGVGSAMCYKILKADGKISCRNTVRSLTLSECADPEHEKLRIDFDTHITDWLGAAATMGSFDTSDLTPEFVY